MIQPDWWKWGDPAKRKNLPYYPKLKQHLTHLFNRGFDDTPGIPATYNLQQNTANVEFVAGVFNTAMPGLKVATDEPTRLNKTLGKSYADLLQAITGMPLHLPDAVVCPANHEEVLQILKTATDYNIQVVPFGGGSNVVGAFDMPAYTPARIVLDMAGISDVVEIDEVHHTATFGAGIYGPALEAALNAKGFTMGHFPQSFEYSTLGGWIATRSAGQESSTYGRIEDMVIGLKVATPAGTVTAGNYEGDAEGINLKPMFYGSEGMLGIITEARVRIHELSSAKKWAVAVFPSFNNGIAAIKQLVQGGVFPSVIRYSDDRETFFLSLLSHEEPSALSKLKSSLSKAVLNFKGIETPSLMMLRFDGDEAEATLKCEMALAAMKQHKGFSVGESLGKKWESSRFGLPYLRDDLMERGIFVDTMETVLPWADVQKFKEELYEKLKKMEAFGGDKGILLAHLSHVYTASTSIYFTVITERSAIRPYEQWQEIKKAVTDAIVQAGGAVSHHHSIGRDHRPWYLQRANPLALQLLRSVKKSLDPHHILNPGKLFDEQE